MVEKRLGYIRLMRPANVVTAVADVLAGIAISGYYLGSADVLFSTNVLSVIFICISTVGLYSGGIIFNDVFDADLDKIERPERPIPSGLITVREASLFGAIFFVIGVVAAAFCSFVSFILSISIVIACLTYNKWAKHDKLLGPLNMGLCRGLNLLLGVSILPPQLQAWWFVAIIPIIYIASITMISRGEVHGGSKKSLYLAAFLYVIVIAFVLVIAMMMQHFVITFLFLLPFTWMIFGPLLKAIHLPSGPHIGRAVKAGVIALILLNAAWASAFGNWQIAVLIIILLPLSLWLSKKFAVT
ncbi:UbiA-like protein EboC [Pedobacter immunditicola]|uniref:UbiA-like protein EboC n=1 Tax=Pedobacter immunditicola TaxID=3133440 RepID=UPI0030B01C56